MAAGAEVETHWGVRFLSLPEMRFIALLAGVLWALYGTFNGVLVLSAHRVLLHPHLFAASGIFADVVGIAIITVGLAIPEAALRRAWPSLLLAVLFTSAALNPLTMYLGRYPDIGGVMLTYSVVVILAFYLLNRPLAFGVVVLQIACHTALEAASEQRLPKPLMSTFVAVAMIAIGYLMAVLIGRLDRAQRSEHAAHEELAALNADLEATVAAQVEQMERLGRLRRFLSAPVADAVLTAQDESALAPHRREIAVLFCDLRGFTAFTKQVEPEEVMEVLAAYYAAAGQQITKFQATLGAFEGDGLMAYLNDPTPCPDPARGIVDLGLAIGDAVDALIPGWERRGYSLSYGIGMAFGHATLGIVGYDGRSDYTAMGTVVNLAARLCSAAGPRELIVDHRIHLAVGDAVELQALEPRAVKGFADPVPSYLLSR